MHSTFLIASPRHEKNMSDELKKARKYAERLRYSGDVALEHGNNVETELTAVRSHHYQNGLCISSGVTPALSKGLGNVYQRLQIPEHTVEAFVYPASEIQAACISDGASACVIRFSSALVETLSAEEFEFVAGHELGHFLLGHGKSDATKDSLECFMRSRAQEISADRIGMTACDSLDTSIRAMMKTISGLTSQHLRFDVGTFISQIRNHTSHSDAYSSHPSMLVRCRALLWFSTSAGLKSNKQQQGNLYAKMDKHIEADLRNYVDGPARKKIEQAKENLTMWLTVRQMCQDKNFDKSEQAQFAELFGKRSLEGLKNYLQTIPATQVRETIDKRADAAQKELIDMIPMASAEEIAKIERLVLERLS